jgi:polysaccharide biosynthesis/export protein
MNGMKIHVFLAGSVIVANAFSAIGQQRVLTAPSSHANLAAVGNTVAGVQQEEHRAGLEAIKSERYMIHSADVLSLTFPIVPELNQLVSVQPDGYINLQSAGALYVQGLTVPELKDALKRAYTGILSDPSMISIDLKDVQKPFFTVTGQVGKPGQYTLRTNLTILEAIAVAGGLSPTAKTQILFFHKDSDAWFRVEKINIKSVLNGKNLKQDAYIKPGDMIFIPEKFITSFRKYVPYSINAAAYNSQTQVY